MLGEFYIARNNDLRDWIVEIIKVQRLPFKIWIQPIYPQKSPNQLGYLFGVVCKRISDYTGHSPVEVYKHYKEYFNIEYSEAPDGIWELRTRGTSDFCTIELEDFAMMIRADAVLELGLNIELPNEVFVSELDFQKYDKIEEQMERSRKTILGKIPRVSLKIRQYKSI